MLSAIHVVQDAGNVRGRNVRSRIGLIAPSQPEPDPALMLCGSEPPAQENLVEGSTV